MKKMQGSTVAGVKGNKTTPKSVKVVTKVKAPVKGKEKAINQWHATRGVVQHAKFKI